MEVIADNVETFIFYHEPRKNKITPAVSDMLSDVGVFKEIFKVSGKAKGGKGGNGSHHFIHDS